MNDPILIIRTVSIEKLNSIVTICVKQWPEHPVWVLTLPGRESEVAQDSRIDTVLTYDALVSFFSAPIIIEKYFESIVIPLGNQFGWGYANVFRALSELRSRSAYVMPYSDKLLKVSRRMLQLKILIEVLFSFLMATPAKITAAHLCDKALNKVLSPIPGIKSEQKLDLEEVRR